MNELLSALRQFLQGLRLWLTVAPWEQALRVRLGKHVTLLRAGVHLKIPLVDVIYVQSVRARVSDFGRQTVTTSDGKAITFAGAVGYEIADLLLLYQSLHHAEDTLRNLARAAIADHVSRSPACECAPDVVVERATQKTAGQFAQYGLGGVCLYITEFALVRTYRVIGDYSGGFYGTALATDIPKT